jgi:hypothetical protein
MGPTSVKDVIFLEETLVLLLRRLLPEVNTSSSTSCAVSVATAHHVVIIIIIIVMMHVGIGWAQTRGGGEERNDADAQSRGGIGGIHGIMIG